MSTPYQAYIKDLVDHFRKTLDYLKNTAKYFHDNSSQLGTPVACILITRTIVEVQATLEDIVAMLGSMRREIDVRATARTLMIETDKELVDKLASQGLIDSEKAQQAKNALDQEEQALQDQFSQLVQDFSNAYSDIDNYYQNVLNEILGYYQDLNCSEAIY